MTSFAVLFQNDGSLIALNLLLQITLLTSAAIGLAATYKYNAAARYSILFSAFVSLPLMIAISLFFQFNNTTLLELPIDITTNESFSIESGLDSAGLVLPELRLELDNSPGEVGLAGSASPSIFSSLRSSLNLPDNIPLYLVLACVWLSGLMIHTIGLLRGFHRLDNIVRSSYTASADESRYVQNLIEKSLSSDQKIVVRTSAQISSPMLTGLFSPLILLPVGFVRGLDESQLRSILLHEIAHIQRGDLLANFIQQLVVAFLWFHPLVQAMDKKILRAREEICDNHVLAVEEVTGYGEALLRASTICSSPAGATSSAPRLAMGIFNKEWKLEHRIRELLDEKREGVMKLDKKFEGSIQLILLVTVIFSAGCQLDISADQRDTDGGASSQQPENITQANPEAPPKRPGSPLESRTTGTLGPQIMRAIGEIQELMQPGEPGSEPDLASAKIKLDVLYESRFERMNDFEKSTLLNTYTNYYLAMEDYPGAIGIFREILEIETLREDTRLRTHRSLGQLFAAEEYWESSISSYEAWRTLSESEDDIVYRGLSYGHYQLEQWNDALRNWRQYMQLKQDSDEELGREDYAYLNGLFFTLKDFESALTTTKEMILLFNVKKDWENLRAIYKALDERNESASSEELITADIAMGSQTKDSGAEHPLPSV